MWFLRPFFGTTWSQNEHCLFGTSPLLASFLGDALLTLTSFPFIGVEDVLTSILCDRDHSIFDDTDIQCCNISRVSFSMI